MSLPTPRRALAALALLSLAALARAADAPVDPAPPGEVAEPPGPAPLPEPALAALVGAPDEPSAASHADASAPALTTELPAEEEAAPALASAPAPSPEAPTGPAATAAEAAVASPPPAEAKDDPVVEREVEAESRELQELRAAEVAVPVHDADPAAPATDRPDAERIPLLPELDHGLAKLQAEFDIPIDVNEAVAQWVRFFQSPLVRPHFVKWLGRYYRYEAYYRAILKEAGLPEDTVFLAMIESGFANFAYSWARASGPWQFISSTGRLFGLQQDFWVDERRDPGKAARAAARYLGELREQLGDWRLAWAGYNAGAGTVQRAVARASSNDFWELARGRVLRRETKGYVPKLMAAAIVTKHHQAFGFTDAEVERLSWVETDEVQLNGSVLLSFVARAAGVEERDLLELNPGLRRAVTPPRPFTLKLPKGASERFAQEWPALEPKARANFAGHVVQRGDTLGAIASKFGTQVEGIMQLNGLTSARRLRIGQELLIPVPRAGPPPATAVAKAEPPKPATASKLAGTPIMEPAGHRPPAAPITGPRHVVQDGDTLWSIAQRIGVDLETLCRWNGIRNPRRHTLKIGTELVVKPAGG
jgi:membrane-bound lytic murein transglycosylase D